MARNRELQREIEVALERAGLHDLLERYRRSHRPGPRPKSKIGYRQLARMWKSFRLKHARQMRPDGEPWTDEQIAAKFLRTQGRQITKLLGLKIKKRGSLRNAVDRGKKESASIRSRRLSRWHQSGRYIVPSLRPYLVTDPQEAKYMQAVVESIFLGKKPTALF